jgi:excisionase family DNA binding protein
MAGEGQRDELSEKGRAAPNKGAPVPENPEQKLLRVPEVAGRLRLSRRTVLGYIRAGALEAINVGQGSRLPAYRVSEAALDRFLADRAVKP